MKAFADYNLNVSKNARLVFNNIEDIVGKRTKCTGLPGMFNTVIMFYSTGFPGMSNTVIMFYSTGFPGMSNTVIMFYKNIRGRVPTYENFTTLQCISRI